MSCGGSAKTNANSARISEVCGQYEDVTVAEGRRIFHRLAYAAEAEAWHEFEDSCGRPARSREDKAQVTALAHQKARWRLESAVAAYAEDKRGAAVSAGSGTAAGTAGPVQPSVGRAWVESAAAGPALDALRKQMGRLLRESGASDEDLKEWAAADVDASLATVSDTDLLRDARRDDIMKRMSQANEYTDLMYPRVHHRALTRANRAVREQAAVEWWRERGQPPPPTDPTQCTTLRDARGGGPYPVRPVTDLKVGDRVHGLPAQAMPNGTGYDVDDTYVGVDAQVHVVEQAGWASGQDQAYSGDVFRVALRNTVTGGLQVHLTARDRLTGQTPSPGFVPAAD